VALVRNRRAVPRVGFPAIKGNAAREAAFRIEPRAPAGIRAERAAGVIRARDRQAMAEIRETGKPFDCVAFCGAIQRMLNEGPAGAILFRVFQKNVAECSILSAARGDTHSAEIASIVCGARAADAAKSTI
jgi:hypothetical protein